MKIDVPRIRSRIVPTGLQDWLRIFPSKHAATPTAAGPGSSRFSSRAKAFVILYAAQDFSTAFAEAVVRDRFAGKARRYLYRPMLDALCVSAIGTNDDLALLDLQGPAAYDLGIDTDAKGARAHDAGQTLSDALHSQLLDLDGILFSSRLTHRPCVAVFERALSKLTGSVPVDFGRLQLFHDEVHRLGVVIRKQRGF